MEKSSPIAHLINPLGGHPSSEHSSVDGGAEGSHIYKMGVPSMEVVEKDEREEKYGHSGSDNLRYNFPPSDGDGEVADGDDEVAGLTETATAAAPALINPNPKVHERRVRPTRAETSDEDSVDRFDAVEVFEHIRDITDPEHPYSLEQLDVVSEDAIDVDDEGNRVLVTFTPTVQHCSMATVIGLCLRVKLMRSLPSRFKIDIKVAPGSHSTEAAVNKQLNDKERVAAALENPHLVEMVDRCLTASEE